MSKNPVAVTTGECFSQLVERIQQAKIARIKSAPAVDLRLTKWDAYEYLSRSCLLKHEVVALLHGMIPHPTETADDYSCMEPDDSVVLRRFLADEKAGRRAYVSFRGAAARTFSNALSSSSCISA